MAFFIRTRRLDLSRLERKPQENIDVVHVILKAAIQDTDAKLRRLERQFYGPKMTAADEIRKWIKSVDSILKSVHMGQITNCWQIDEIMKQASEPTTNFSVDLFELNRLKECYRKIRDVVPEKFSDIMSDCRTVLKYLDKYCLSFYNPETDVPYETGQHYEQKRRDALRMIRNNLDEVNRSAEKFQQKAKGFSVADLTDYGFDLARKTNSTHAAFLVLFPQCVENIRVVLRLMTSLIDADSNYPTFVRNDVTDFEQKKDQSLKAVRTLQNRYHQLGFRLKQLEAEANRMEADIQKLSDKELDLMIKEEELVAETNEMQVEIEMKEHRRDQLLKEAAHLHPQFLYEKYGELSESLRDLKRRLPFIKRELFAVRHKLSWVSGKKVELRNVNTKLAQIKKEMQKVDEERQEHEVEHDSVVRCLDLAKKILLRKVSADSIEKIFHERPVEANRARLPGHRPSDDPFERVCTVVAKSIESDWPRLYRALPFYPPRGVATIDNDIEELTNMESRLGVEDLALKSLYRWRRHHTRAKLEDIHVALTDIKRYDILGKIDLDLNPPEEVEPEQEEPITYVDEYLVPFVRQVERFDQLRAQNRL